MRDEGKKAEGNQESRGKPSLSIAALVTVAKGGKSPHVHKLRMDKRKWSIHMVEFYSAIKKIKGMKC